VSSRWLGQSSGHVAPTEVRDVTVPISTVRLETCDSGDDDSSMGDLGASLEIADMVPESEVSGASSDSGKSGSITVEAEELDFTLKVGGFTGMTCDGQVGQLKEVMGKLLAEKQGSGMGGERGSQVLNEL
jgi:hypothetical protein